MARKPKIERFNEKILSRFQIYNSLFLTLPFKTIKETSLYLPLFAEHCKKGYQAEQNPKEIVQSFFKRFAPDLSAVQKKTYCFTLYNILKDK